MTGSTPCQLPPPQKKTEQRALSLDFHEGLIHNLKTRQVAMTSHPGISLTVYSSVKTKVKQTLRGHAHPPSPAKVQESYKVIYS